MVSGATPSSGTSRVVELCKEMLSRRPLLLVSNRGPIEYYVNESGDLSWRRGAGGVVTALSAISHYAPLTWIACAMGEGDRRAAHQAEGKAMPSPMPGQKLQLRFIIIPRNVYHKYYNVLCNPLLWFLQHYMWNSPHTPNVNAAVYDAWDNGYVLANRAFADAVIDEAQTSDPPPFIMLHDYHLYLAAGYIRPAVPGAILQHFIHIPWPSPVYWQLLPRVMRSAICTNLCANDIIGFQTVRDVRNFLHSCEAFLPQAEVDYRRRTVWFDGHLSTVNAYPISIDLGDLQRTNRSARVRDYEERLRPLCGEQTIVRVDRAEPSKNLVRGFRAFEILLDRYPDLHGKVNFLAFLVPSRTSIRQYRRYVEEVDGVVSAINERFANDNWTPIRVFFENNYAQAIAGMRLFDVLLVNAVIDGMNLVAKEGPVVNTKDGVLVLSETVGAYEELGEYALGVAPADLEGTMRAMHQALTMPPEERHARAQSLRKTIGEHDVGAWLCRQFDDLMTLS